MLKLKPRVLPQIKDIDESEFAVVCHCSNSKHQPLYYIQDGKKVGKIGNTIKHIDPSCPKDNWNNITDNSVMYIWGIYCPIYTSYSDTRIITIILNNSFEKLKLNGGVLFPVLDENINEDYL